MKRRQLEAKWPAKTAFAVEEAVAAKRAALAVSCCPFWLMRRSQQS